MSAASYDPTQDISTGFSVFCIKSVIVHFIVCESLEYKQPFEFHLHCILTGLLQVHLKKRGKHKFQNTFNFAFSFISESKKDNFL